MRFENEDYNFIIAWWKDLFTKNNQEYVMEFISKLKDHNVTKRETLKLAYDSK